MKPTEAPVIVSSKPSTGLTSSTTILSIVGSTLGADITLVIVIELSTIETDELPSVNDAE